MKASELISNEVKLKKIKRLINSFYKAEEKDGCWSNDKFAANAIGLIDKIYLEVGGKLER